MKSLLTSYSLMVALFAALFTLTLHSVSHAQTLIHVDAVNGINAATGRGAPGKAYKSITYALLISQKSNLPDPWHVHIHPGTYDANPAKPSNEREIFPLKLRSKMIFQGTTTAAECIIDAQHLGETQKETLLGLDVGEVSIRNLTVQNMHRTNGAGGIVFWDTGGARETPSSIEACIVHNNSIDGVGTNLPLVLIGNTFSNNRRFGVWTSTSLTVLNNTFSHNEGTGLVFHSEDSNYNFVGNISDNIFENNVSGFSVNRHLTGNVTRNQFIGGSTEGWQDSHRGGGFWIERLTGNVSDNIFKNNSTRTGGGFQVDTLIGDVTHNTFENNTSRWGSGFYVNSILSGDVTHNTFENNTADDAGGGFGIEDLDHGEDGFTGKITHNLFDSNSVTREVGGAISLLTRLGNAEITNNIFFNNTASGAGSSVHVNVPSSLFMNNLFMVSDALSAAASISAVKVEKSKCRFHNNIFSGIKTAIYTEGVFDLPITHNLFHNIGLDFVNQDGSGVGSDLDFWELLADGANNNIVGGLLLVAPEKRDFHPLAGSPTIDAGTNEYAPADDFDGVARPVGGAVDIGPYEYEGSTTGVPMPVFLVWDVNEDGQVSILDLIVVAQNLGQPASEAPRADINADGTINILDLILVSQHLGERSAPPAHISRFVVLDASLVQTWLELARVENDGSVMFHQGIANLESLLASLLPKETALLPNYPNPFNPETWIPYQLASPTDVTLRVHAVDGSLVRTLSLGHKPIGIYQTRSRAVYWDGKNEVGESVASGVYFYTLTAGDFSATRKLLIRK